MSIVPEVIDDLPNPSAKIVFVDSQSVATTYRWSHRQAWRYPATSHVLLWAIWVTCVDAAANIERPCGTASTADFDVPTVVISTLSRQVPPPSREGLEFRKGEDFLNIVAQ
jgi:hypothetical protein